MEVILSYYNSNYQKYFNDTCKLDMSHLYDKFILKLPYDKSRILDLGCGSGRDSKNFNSIGHLVVSMDACSNLIKLAKKENSGKGITYYTCDFITAKLPMESFHAVWANDSLSHCLPSELSQVFENIDWCLKENGIVFCNFPKGIGVRFEDNGLRVLRMDGGWMPRFLDNTNLTVEDSWEYEGNVNFILRKK